jgi:hypothetical protein
MTINRIDGTPPELPENRQVAHKPEKTATEPWDQLELSLAGRSESRATYTRSDVASATIATQPAEVTMAQDARAQKLASTRQRMEAGVYNSREMIERVVDRLLEKWNLYESGGLTKPPS